MAVLIPLSAIPSQQFQIVLNGQDCEITVFTRNTGLFLDLIVDGQTVQDGAIILNGVPIIQAPNGFFSGTLCMHDLWGEDNPEYTGLGERWVLAYYSATEKQPGNGNPVFGVS